MISLYYSVNNFSIGKILIGANDDKVHYLGLPNANREMFIRWAQKHGYQLVETKNQLLIKKISKELDEYLHGKRNKFDVSFHLSGTPFQKKVWDAISNIPYGQTRSYQDIACDIGKPKAVRAVGTACGANPVPLLVPCHRVVKTDGTMGNYGGGITLKKKLLKLEQ